ncbi:sulfite exporter TauE/SafE family protein [Candidatus Woesearchaeota archaeon]|nr:sulfite exporter TauE/SafE family protein [Candidatus Woesearchaeota archaeon]
MTEATIAIAFIAGLISFLSPCILPLIPAFLSYLSGSSLEEIRKGQARKLPIILNTVFFVLGFSIIFAAIGVLLNTIFKNVSVNVLDILGKVGGIIIILFGLYVIGLLPKLSFLEREHKIRVRAVNIKYLNSFVFGAAFAIGWTPCVGAVLAGILTLAITQPASAFSLLISYSLGLTVPFLLTGVFLSQATGFIGKHKKALKYFNIAAGIILITLGILVFTDNLVRISNFAGPLNNLFLDLE